MRMIRVTIGVGHPALVVQVAARVAVVLAVQPVCPARCAGLYHHVGGIVAELLRLRSCQGICDGGHVAGIVVCVALILHAVRPQVQPPEKLSLYEE